MANFAPQAAAATGTPAALDITEIDVERDSDDERTIRLAALLVLEALSGVWRRSS